MLTDSGAVTLSVWSGDNDDFGPRLELTSRRKAKPGQDLNPERLQIFPTLIGRKLSFY